MRRYRKGETFRPPTAAESSASADALEGHRRRASQPQDLAPVGQTIVVKTPVDGIPARDNDTIYWEKCHRCIERYTANEKEIVETDETIIVHNLFTQAVLGDTYVATALTECGTRYTQLALGYDRCTCTLKGALATTDASTTVDNVEIIRGTSPLDDPTDTTEELTVYNTHDWDGDDNAICRIEYNCTSEHWEFYQVTCPA